LAPGFAGNPIDQSIRLASDPPGDDAVRAFRDLREAGRDAAPQRVVHSEMELVSHARMLPCSMERVKHKVAFVPE